MKRILSWAMIIAMLMTFILFDATVFTALAAPTTFADETALQAALTAASPGDSVDLSGAVSLTADLSIPIGVILTSSDGTGELDLDSGSYGNAPIVLGYSGLAYSSTPTEIRGLKIVDKIGASWPRQIVYTSGFNNIIIDSCRFDCSAGLSQYILCLDGNPHAVVTNNIFIGNYKTADVTWPLYMEGFVSPASTLTLTGNTFTECGQSALDYAYLDPAGHSTISGNIFDSTDAPLAFQFANLASASGAATAPDDYATVIMNNYKVADASAYKTGDPVCRWMADPIQVQDYAGFTNPVAAAGGSFDRSGGTTQITYPFSYTFTASDAVIKDPYQTDRKVIEPAAPADVSSLTLYAIPGSTGMPLPSVPSVDPAALPAGGTVLDSTMGLKDAGGNLIGTWLVTAVINDNTVDNVATVLVDSTSYTDDFTTPTAIANDVTSYANMVFALQMTITASSTTASSATAPSATDPSTPPTGGNFSWIIGLWISGASLLLLGGGLWTIRWTRKQAHGAVQ